MEHSDTLLGFAELGVGLGGFASIFLALTRRGERLAPGDAYPVRWMLINSLGAAGLAIVPVAVEALGLAPPRLWQLCSGLHVALMLAGTIPAALQESRRLDPEQRASIDPRVQAFGWCTAGAIFLAQALNTLGWLVGPAAGPYLVSLGLMLVVGGVHFIGLLFRRLL